MSNYVSPGLYLRENDFSLYGQDVTPTIVGMIVTATRGPLNTLLNITSPQDLFAQLGPLNSNHLGLYSIVQYLQRGNQTKVVRVASSAYRYASVNVSGSSQLSMTISGSTPGTYANDIVVAVSNGTISNTFKLTVNYRNIAVEAYDNLNKTTSSSDYVETRVNPTSKYITVVDNESSSQLPVNGNYTLAGGNDGLTGISAADYIGTAVGLNPTGMQIFADPDTVDINLFAIPGVSTGSVLSNAISMCENRSDALFVMDPPFGLSKSQVIDWHNGVAPYNDHSAFNSSYAALYWPWVKITDPSINAPTTTIWVPPSGFVLEHMALTDKVADPWFAPAGLNRGILTNADDIEVATNIGDRNNLYSGGNAVNPIIKMSGQGIVIWGQRTTQRATTALDRVNVRRMLIFAKRVISLSIKYLVFEPNDPTTWQQFINTVEPVLESMAKRRGITQFSIQCDASTNTPEVIERGEMSGKIRIKPTKTAEIIVVDFNLTDQRASFSS